MKSMLFAAAALGLVALPFAAQSQAPAPTEAKTPKYSVETSMIGDLLDNPDTKAILVKHLPDVAQSDQIDMARAMTLRDIQQYAPDVITEEKLALIEADLKALG